MIELTDIQKRALEQFDELAQKEGSANKAAARIGISIVTKKIFSDAVT